MKRVIYVVCIFLFCNTLSYAQYENGIWFFHKDHKIDFSSGALVLSNEPNNIPDATIGMSAICDARGNLIFYTDGNEVWDRQHKRMPNSRPLFGKYNSNPQGALVIQAESNSNIYHLLSLESVAIATGETFGQTSGNLYMSTIDMSLNNGLGDIVAGSTHTIATGLTQHMVGVRRDCGGVWIIVHERDNNKFVCLLLDHGKIIDRVETTLGARLYDISTDATGWLGDIKVSNRNTLALIGRKGLLNFFTFDPNTGIISNSVDIYRDLPRGSFRTLTGDFSPNGDYYYFIKDIYPDERTLQQFDVSTLEFQSIVDSEVSVGSIDKRMSGAAMQMGPDDRMYISLYSLDPFWSLSTIENPNLKGQSCDFRYESIPFGSRILSLGISTPYIVASSQDSDIVPSDSSICLTAASITFDLDRYDSIRWSTGDRGSDLTISGSGPYSIMAYESGCLYRDTINISVEEDSSTGFISVDGDLCAEGNIQLNSPYPNTQWWDESISQSLSVMAPGTYWANAQNDVGCMISDTVVINTPYIEVSIDTLLCAGQTYLLDGQMIRDAGIYVDTIYAERACDTIVSLYLGVAEAITGDTITITFTERPYIYDGNTYPDQGYYQETYMRDNTCDSTIVIHIISDEGGNPLPSQHLVMSNVFSPNSDGVNDVFAFELPEELEIEETAIYDRWGTEIYRSRNDNSPTWDGQIKGKEAHTGVYFYRLIYIDQENNRNITSGDLTLIR